MDGESLLESDLTDTDFDLDRDFLEYDGEHFRELDGERDAFLEPEGDLDVTRDATFPSLELDPDLDLDLDLVDLCEPDLERDLEVTFGERETERDLEVPFAEPDLDRDLEIALGEPVLDCNCAALGELDLDLDLECELFLDSAGELFLELAGEPLLDLERDFKDRTDKDDDDPFLKPDSDRDDRALAVGEGDLEAPSLEPDFERDLKALWFVLEDAGDTEPFRDDERDVDRERDFLEFALDCTKGKAGCVYSGEVELDLTGEVLRPSEFDLDLFLDE